MSRYLSLINVCAGLHAYFKPFLPNRTMLRISVIIGLIAINPAHADLVTCSSASGLDCFEFGADHSESFVEQALSDALSETIDIVLYGNSIDDASLFFLTTGGSSEEGSPGIESVTGSQTGTWTILDGFEIDYISIVATNSGINSTSTVSIYDVGGSSGTFSLDALNLGFENKYFIDEINFWYTLSSVDEPAALLLLLLSGTIFAVRRSSRKTSLPSGA